MRYDPNPTVDGRDPDAYAKYAQRLDALSADWWADDLDQMAPGLAKEATKRRALATVKMPAVPEPTTPLDLEAIRKRVEAATPEPWARYTKPFEVFTEVDYGVNDPPAVTFGSEREEDAEFIAHARTDVPALLAEVERLTLLRAADARSRDELSAALSEAQRERDDLVLAVKARDIAVREADGLRAAAERREELMRPVVEAARVWRWRSATPPTTPYLDATRLEAAVDAYEASQTPEGDSTPC